VNARWIVLVALSACPKHIEAKAAERRAIRLLAQAPERETASNELRATQFRGWGDQPAIIGARAGAIQAAGDGA
jgi:hypothetical protein